jgi:uncharacterized protein (TIGR03437 family)
MNNSKLVTWFFLALAGTRVVAAAVNTAPQHSLDSLPYRFEENRGQAPAGARFVARDGNYEVLIGAAGPVLVLKSAGTQTSLATVLQGGNRGARISGEQPAAARANFLLGNDPSKWLRDVPNFGRVRYSEVYPSTDLIFYGNGHGNGNNLEFDFEVKPGGDPSQISLSWTGADKVKLDGNGDLLIATAAGEVRWAKPTIYQLKGNRRTPVEGAFRLENNIASFAVSQYDRNATLVVDPTVSFATYIGGSSNESARAIGLDPSGNILIAGVTTTTTLPTASGVAQPGYAGGTTDTITGDAFVAKLNPAGTALVWITYLGGSMDDVAFGMAVDAQGSAYITGMTNSTNFPVKNAAYSTFLGARGNILNPMGDAFVTKLNSSGQLVYSTYFGGTSDDVGTAIAIDTAGDAYITGNTLSTNLPIGLGAFQNSFKGSGGNLAACGGCGPVFLTGDAFAAKFDPNGKFLWTTYIGGSLDDFAMAIAADATGVYIAGGTLSSDFPVTSGALQTKYGGASNNQAQPYIHMGDGFVVKLDPLGSKLLYGTYLGGSQDDAIFGMALDSSGDVYVTGATVSSDFPVTSGVFQSANKGPSTATTNRFVYGDGFAAKLNPTGTGLLYATLFGGSGDDAGQAITIDAAGDAYIVGQTASKDFPTVSPTQTSYAGSGGESQIVGDAFVFQLDPKGAVELFGTYMGGNSDDAAAGIVLDGSGNAYVTGYTLSTNFPATKGSFQTVFGGWTRSGAPYGDAFVAKFSGLGVSGAPSILSGGVVPVYSTSTTVQPGSWFSIYGSNLASTTTLWNGNFPTSLGGTSVTIDGKSAYLWFVSAGQINAQAPDDTATGSVPVVVNTSTGTVSSTVKLAPASPAFLLLSDAKHATGIIITPNGSGSQGGGTYDLLGPTSQGAGFRAAKLGEPVAIYGVGFGPTNPAVPSGQIYNCPAAGCATLAATPQITVGGASVAVVFGGIVGAGLYQFNFSIPQGIGTGDQPIVAIVNGVSTQTGVVIPIQ